MMTDHDLEKLREQLERDQPSLEERIKRIEESSKVPRSLLDEEITI
jgi:hypothetical protein